MPSRGIAAAAVVWPFAALGIKVPFLVLYFQQIGLSESEIALLFGLAAAAVFATQQLWGYLADVGLGRRRCLLAMSLGGALASLLLALPRGFAAMLPAMLLFAVFHESRTPIINAVLLGAARGRQRLFGVLRSIGSLVFVAAAIATAVIVDRSATWGIYWIFPLLVGANLMFAGALLVHREVLPSAGSARPSFAEVQRILLARPAIRAFLLFVLLYQLPHNFSMLMQGFLVRELGYGFLVASAPLLIGAVIEIPAFIWVKDLLRRCPMLLVFLFCVLAQAGRWLVIHFFPVVEVILVANALHLVTFGVMYMCAILFMDEQLPREYRSSGQSLLNMCYMTVGMMLGPFVSAFVLQVLRLDIVQWYGFAGLLVLLSLPALWLLAGTLRREAAGNRD